MLGLNHIVKVQQLQITENIPVSHIVNFEKTPIILNLVGRFLSYHLWVLGAKFTMSKLAYIVVMRVIFLICSDPSILMGQCIDPSMYCLSLETKGPNIAIVVVKFVQFWRKPNNVQVCSISFVDDVYNVQSSCGRFWGISLNLASSPGQMSFRAWGCKFIDGVRGNESGLWHVIYWMKVPHLIWHRLRNVVFFLQKMRFHEKFCLGSLTSVMKLPPCCRRCRKNS